MRCNISRFSAEMGITFTEKLPVDTERENSKSMRLRAVSEEVVKGVVRNSVIQLGSSSLNREIERNLDGGKFLSFSLLQELVT
ncbi:hypothetical protein NPIL_482471 [Nephila pilipes]|uniref:Uncharacterized protein n=1 Tax=Nephila pilipes TaxID=299642 RepID=A0A8X6QVR1_NEPPI|nr:hypothetical protein NPIL_482471 [Nephila pilipes]